jgi:hypothetical protein
MIPNDKSCDHNNGNGFEKEQENVSTYIMLQKYLSLEQIDDYFEIEITLAPC